MASLHSISHVARLAPSGQLAFSYSLCGRLLFYNNATKMKEVPVPFPYVQLNALLLNLFACLLCPIAIASFTTVAWLSITTTVVTVISFYSVFIVANELEDPFGTEVNDMPMLEFHEEVNYVSACT